jgi:hypothetical protein
MIQFGLTDKDLKNSGNMNLSGVDHISKNVVAVSHFVKMNKLMLQYEKIRKSS